MNGSKGTFRPRLHLELTVLFAARRLGKLVERSSVPVEPADVDKNFDAFRRAVASSVNRVELSRLV